MITVGDKIKLKTDAQTYIGILMESPDKNKTILKLDNGYNIGINKKRVNSLILLKKKDKKAKSKVELKFKKNIKKISILHTGGTIASQVDYETGAVTPKFAPEDIISMFPELKNLANVNSRLIRNMASDDMRFAHFNIIAKEIQKEINKGVDGVIITQGTDNLHYTSAALAFILHNLSKPVLIVGSQRSSDRGSSDAAMNLICATNFIVNSNFCDVAVCMHKNTDDDFCTILPATKVRKMHSSRRNAFQPINTIPWAEVNYNGKVKFLCNDYKKLKSERKLEIKLLNEKLKIGLFKVHPNMFAKELEVYENFDGLILEGTGLGHFPITEMDEFTKEHKKIFNVLKKLAKKMPVVMSPQTIFGRINMNVYTPGRKLLDIGIIGNYSDMTPETTFIKLAWLLSNDKKSLKEKMSENLVGEINKRIGNNFF